MSKAMPYQYNDGGRAVAGYKGTTNDCVVRACAIVLNKPYKEVYNALYEASIALGEKGNSKDARYARRKPSPRFGVTKKVMTEYLNDNGWKWTACMQIGSGCQVHLKADELPLGVIITRLSRHVAVVKDRVLHDTFDSSREGTRCVYGYYEKKMVRTKFKK